MTAVTPEANAVPQTDLPRNKWLVRRLTALLGRLRRRADDDLEVIMAHALEEAFRAIARDFRS